MRKFEINGHEFYCREYQYNNEHFGTEKKRIAWAIFFYQNHISTYKQAAKYGLTKKQFFNAHVRTTTMAHVGGIKNWLLDTGYDYKKPYVPETVEQKEEKKIEVLSKRFGKYYDGHDYHSYLETEWWGKIRGYVFERDEHECQLCKSQSQLNAHHMSYKRLASDKEWDDVVTLCRECHEDFHDNCVYDKEKFEFTQKPYTPLEKLKRIMTWKERKTEREIKRENEERLYEKRKGPYNRWKYSEKCEDFYFPVEDIIF